MRTTRFVILVSFLASAAFAQTDAPGVTVSMNGASVIHRASVPYPTAAVQNGVRGMLSVEVRTDQKGNVADARVLSGPEELRNTTLQSVLQWHFMRESAASTRVVQIAFDTPAPMPAIARRAPGALPPVPRSGGIMQPRARIRAIQGNGVSPAAMAEILPTLPVREGDEFSSETMLKANAAVRAYDEHLTLRGNPEGAEMSIEIVAPNSSPQRIKVGGNIQSTMIVNKVIPIYPPEAKAARVSGVVHLTAVIGPDGAIQALSVLEGPEQLSQAAYDAVRQWVYKPTLLNGNPVQVETTIDVNFTLNN